DRLLGSGPGSLSGYFRAKMAQENLIKASGIPFTIVHATQFFEFVKNIAQSATDRSTVRLSPVLMQPMVSDDVAAAVADVALGEPMNAMVEVAGPDKIRQDELVRQFLTATGDPRKVVTDANAGYYGIKVNDQSLVPGHNPRLGSMHFAEWIEPRRGLWPGTDRKSTRLNSSHLGISYAVFCLKKKKKKTKKHIKQTKKTKKKKISKKINHYKIKH